MRILANKQNVIAPAFPYSFGRIQDNPGNGTGTPVDEDVYGDFHQFFALLLPIGQVTPNDLEENGTNGYQSIIALQNIPKAQYDIFHQVGGSLEPPYQNSFATSAYITALEGLRYKLDAKTNRVYFSGACQRATESILTAFTLPVAYRPAQDRAIPMLLFNNGIFIPCLMKVNATTGAVSFLGNAGDTVSLATYIVDGISFNLF